MKTRAKAWILDWRLAAMHVFLVCILLACAVDARASEGDPKGFVNSIAENVYTWAWPTATYESISIKSVDPVEGGYDVLVKLSGKSGFGGGDLWLVLVLELRDGVLSDIRVSNHNAILAAPFSTVKAMGELLAELAAEKSYSTDQRTNQTTSENSLGYKFYVTNRCRYPVKVAIKYLHPDGSWQAVGWWGLNGNASRYLNFADGTYALTKSTAFYGYAETEDRSIYWGGNDQVAVEGRSLGMLRLEDSEGDSEWTLTCDGR